MLTGFDLCRAAMAVEGITAPEQAVLTTLAIMANDDAQCWPGINGAAGITGKTKLSERTVQRSLQGLKDAGHINWVDKPGRGRVYVVHPRHAGTPNEATPATVTPRQPDTRQSGTPATVTPTPATVAPNLPRTTIPSEKASPSQSVARVKPADPFPRPAWAEANLWADFLVNRKRKNLSNTATAHSKLLADIDKLTDDAWPPGRILEAATAKGWGAIYPAIKDDDDGHRNGTERLAGNHRTGGRGRTISAAERFIADGQPGGMG